MDWTRQAEEISRLLKERGDFLRAARCLTDEDLRWVNKHLDDAFIGRHDHLRFDTPEWVRLGSIN